MTRSPPPLIARPAIGTALVLMIPLVMTWLDRAKPPGDGWRWSPMDFVIMGALLLGAGLAYEVLTRRVRRPGGKWLVGAGIFAVVVLIWVELAVDGVSQLLQFLTG